MSLLRGQLALLPPEPVDPPEELPPEPVDPPELLPPLPLPPDPLAMANRLGSSVPGQPDSADAARNTQTLPTTTPTQPGMRRWRCRCMGVLSMGGSDEDLLRLVPGQRRVI